MEPVLVWKVMATAAIINGLSMGTIKMFSVDEIGVYAAFTILLVFFSSMAAFIISALWLVWHL